MAEEKKKVEKKITRADGTAKVKSKEERHGDATPKRIIAIIFWVLGIACEVLFILTINKTLYVEGLLGLSQMIWLIIFIVLDLIFVIIGSQFWKKGNDIDPASKSNKAKYFIQNQMGLIVSIIAFLPMVIVLITNKDLDKKTKKILLPVAIVALVVCSALSIDWNPISEEEYEQVTTALDGEAVYWTRYGKSYHLDPNCSALTRSNELIEGTITQAIEAGRSDPCDFCVHQEETTK